MNIFTFLKAKSRFNECFVIKNRLPDIKIQVVKKMIAMVRGNDCEELAKSLQ